MSVMGGVMTYEHEFRVLLHELHDIQKKLDALNGKERAVSLDSDIIQELTMRLFLEGRILEYTAALDDDVLMDALITRFLDEM